MVIFNIHSNGEAAMLSYNVDMSIVQVTTLNLASTLGWSTWDTQVWESSFKDINGNSKTPPKTHCRHKTFHGRWLRAAVTCFMQKERVIVYKLYLFQSVDQDDQTSTLRPLEASRPTRRSSPSSTVGAPSLGSGFFHHFFLIGLRLQTFFIIFSHRAQINR